MMKIKIASFILFSFICLGVTAQVISVKLSGNIFNTDIDSVYVSQFYSTHYVDYLRAALDEKGNFEVEGSLPQPDFYVLRVGSDRINLVLRDGADIKVYADGRNVNAYGNIIGSDESSRMKDFILTMQIWEMKRDSLMAEMKADPSKEDVAKAKLNQEYSLFSSNRRAYIAQNSNSPILLPALTSIDPEQDWATYDMVAKQLAGSLPGSPTIENTVKNYQALKAEREKWMMLAPGKQAPDFEQADVNGKPMKLSDLRGQVVLLDFWASWCGPCRRENPNVVALYEKYKDEGFTVMSVSLDKSKPRWLQAIEQDRLVWPNHVSDLKGWGNEAAAKYGVRGIPFTVLIDRDGNIIQTRLRGAALEAELAKLFEK